MLSIIPLTDMTLQLQALPVFGTLQLSLSSFILQATLAAPFWIRLRQRTSMRGSPHQALVSFQWSVVSG
jgi:hypothetical protein